MCFLHLLDLLQPTYVAFPAVEFRTQERSHELSRELCTDDFRPDAEHVHVVVLDALVRGVRVVADRRADARQLACCDGGADAGSAHQHAALRVSLEDRVAELLGLVRVVDPDARVVGAARRFVA